MSKQNKQPLLQHPAVVGVLASLLSIVIGLVLGFVLLVLLNPGASLGGMKAMMTTGFSSMDKLGKVLYQAAPLMMCGLSVGFAFKTGLFNIGASGQYTMGAFFSLLCAIQFQMPWYVCLLAGAVFCLGRVQLGPHGGAVLCKPRGYPAQGAVCRTVRQFELDQHFYHHYDCFCCPRLGRAAKDHLWL